MKVEPDRPKSRRTLLLLGAAFALPLAGAFALYYGSSWRPAASTAHGTLLQPVRALPALTLPRAKPPAESSSGTTTASNLTDASTVQFKELWSLVVIADGRCDSECRTALTFARQEQLMLGRLGTRLQRVWLATGECCDWKYLTAEQSGLAVVNAGTADSALVLTAFPADDRAHTLYVVDPRGNLLLRYRSDLPPNGLRDDLKKLLDLSHIG